MKKLISLALAAVLALGILSGCGKKADAAIQIAVPNDTTNEARALLLLEANGIIKLKDGAGITATKNDIVENPYNVEIVEAEAARLPDMLKDADYAVINSNYAINAGLNPVKDSLAIEGSSSAYSNILAVKEGTENSDSIKALKAALESKQVADYISEKYDGAYCYLMISGKTTQEVQAEAAAKVSQKAGSASAISYEGDVNGTKNVDINDAQLVYDMYRAKYGEFTQTVAVENFLRADMDGSKNVTVKDAAEIVAKIHAEFPVE